MIVIFFQKNTTRQKHFLMTKIVFKMLDINWEVINCDKIDKKTLNCKWKQSSSPVFRLLPDCNITEYI